MCPVQLSDTPNMVRAEGFEPSRLCVRSAVSCPVERRPHSKWFRDQGSNLEPAGSEPADLPIDLSRNGGEARNRTENRWNQNPLLCQLSYLPTNNGVTGGNRTHVGCSTDIRLNHSATATLVPGVGIEPTFAAFQTAANPSQLSRRIWWTPRELNPADYLPCKESDHPMQSRGPCKTW